MAGQSDMNAIAQFEQAVNTMPPDVALARTAINGISESLSAMASDERIRVLRHGARLAGNLATAVTTQGVEDSAQVATEFTTHAANFNNFAAVLDPPEVKDPTPTRTKGKDQTGGKR